MRASDQSGAALVVALVVLTGLALLATGLLFVSVEESAIARSAAASLRARVAAESATHAALAGWRTATARELVVGSPTAGEAAHGELPDGSRYRATVERLSAELFLVRGQGWAPGDLAAARVGRLVRVLAPEVLESDFRAALVSPRPIELEGETVVHALGPEPDAVAETALCPGADGEDAGVPEGERPGILVRAASDLTTGPGVSVRGEPDILVDPAVAEPETAAGLETVSRSELLRIADRIEAGRLRIGPAERSGACDIAAMGNWGTPDEPASPCAGYFPLIAAPGDLEVAGGAGQGVLVVYGDLRLGAETQFRGAVYVAGRLLAPHGATVSGAVRVGAGPAASRLTDVRIFYDLCDLRLAFQRSTALEQPVRPSGRSWIPLF